MNVLLKTLALPLRLSTSRESTIFRLSKPLRKANTRTFFIPKENKFTTGVRSEKLLKQKDQVASTVILVYKNPFSRWIEVGYHFQRAFLIVVSAAIIYSIKVYLNNELKFPYVVSGYMIVRTGTELCYFTVVGLNVLIIPIFLCKWSVIRIYFDKAKDVYTAVLVGHLPFKRKIITIKPMSVSPVIRKIVPKEFRTFEYKVDNKRLLMYDDYFRVPADLNKMLTFLH